MFGPQLAYKAMEVGCELVTLNPLVCLPDEGGCGSIILKDVIVRLHGCPDCGLPQNRFVNAAKHVIQLGYRRWASSWEVAPIVAQVAARL